MILDPRKVFPVDVPVPKKKDQYSSLGPGGIFVMTRSLVVGKHCERTHVSGPGGDFITGTERVCVEVSLSWVAH